MSTPDQLVGRKFSAEPLDVQWIHGSPSSKHNTDPDLQVHWYDEHTVILRQNKAIDYEAPFLFLLFGERARSAARHRRHRLAGLLSAAPGRRRPHRDLARLVNPRDGYGLLVLHTHAHGDHVAGDGQFADRADTVRRRGATRTPPGSSSASPSDADAIRPVDLGGRVLQAFATPGHHAAAVTFYDPWTGFLLTGDTVYRGRLYIVDWAAFRDSIDRLIEFSAAHRSRTCSAATSR